MLSRNPTRSQHILQLRDIKPENRHDERECDSWEEVEILSCFVERRRMLKDGKTAGADSHEGEPLPLFCVSLKAFQVEARRTYMTTKLTK